MVADRTIEKAAKQELKLTQATKAYENPTSIAVSTDGFWMKRGHMPLFGIGAVIGVRTGQLIDCVIKSVHCKVCKFWETKKCSEEFGDFVNNHWLESSASQERSSGKIEVTGALEIFERSVKKQTEGFNASH